MDNPIEAIEGFITRKDGTTTAFIITGSGYSQWSGTTPELGANVDALTALATAAEPHLTTPYTQN